MLQNGAKHIMRSVFSQDEKLKGEYCRLSLTIPNKALIVRCSIKVFPKEYLDTPDNKIPYMGHIGLHSQMNADVEYLFFCNIINRCAVKRLGFVKEGESLMLYQGPISAQSAHEALETKSFYHTLVEKITACNLQNS